MSVCYRTALLQTLALPTDEPDPDHAVFERRTPVGRDPLLEAKLEVAEAWRAGHEGEFNADAMGAHYQEFAGKPVSSASAVELHNYASRLLEGLETQP